MKLTVWRIKLLTDFKKIKIHKKRFKDFHIFFIECHGKTSSNQKYIRINRFRMNLFVILKAVHQLSEESMKPLEVLQILSPFEILNNISAIFSF